jgi:hypothetical protein
MGGPKYWALPLERSLIIGSKVLSPHLGESKIWNPHFWGSFKYGALKESNRVLKNIGPTFWGSLMGSKNMGPSIWG